ncbi:M56 family metallopeptidase [Clostridium sp. YIM B02506]|uniref:M56 family metallopeptidase n=1 Tax=Clostridium sp. YIM B02506 TaxID=2910680 RepID=UPI001EED6F55
MKNIFEYLLNMSITGTYVALVVILVRVLLKKSPKIFSYILWIPVFFRLIVPFSINSILSFMPKINTPISYQVGNSNNLSSNSNIAELVESNILPNQSNNDLTNMDNIMKTLAVIWIVGFVIFLSKSLLDYIRLKNKLKFATLIEENIYETDSIESPFVFGVLKPRIYMPVNIKQSEFEYMLNHEKVHVKRKDYIIKLFAFFIVMLHWFNPVVWMCYYLMEKDMEMSCDESVIKNYSVEDKKTYSNILLSYSVRKSSLTTPFAFGESSVKARIKNILVNRKRTFLGILITSIIVIAVIIGLVTNSYTRSFIKEDVTETLYKNKTPYVGDNSKVVNIVSGLDFPEGAKVGTVQLQTDDHPYGINVSLVEFGENKTYFLNEERRDKLEKNAILMFALIDNLDIIKYYLGDRIPEYTREWASEKVGEDITNYGTSIEKFKDLNDKLKNIYE